ncbi:hypothetical protein AQ809_20915 [Burkholderia pseudomallei]|nr:hypothetical protein AQ760_25365 [Burkholderia pseudomallei]OMW48033.1 hypothetical protein AQ809_20915 [Burkholderia pseudomallei]
MRLADRRGRATRTSRAPGAAASAAGVHRDSDMTRVAAAARRLRSAPVRSRGAPASRAIRRRPRRPAARMRPARRARRALVRTETNLHTNPIDASGRAMRRSAAR